MLKLDESFSWAFQDPSWRIKILLQGLMLLIPVFGVIALLGWMLANLENIRDGRYALARNGFYIVDGIEMFCVWLIYSVVLAIPYAVVATIAANVPRNATWIAASGAANLAGLLALGWLLPAMIVATDREGFLVGVGPRRLLKESVQTPFRTLVAAVLMVVAFLIGLSGFFCFVGVLFTLPYAATVLAAIASWWERPQRAATADAPPPGMPGPQVPLVAPIILPPSEPVGVAATPAAGGTPVLSRLPPTATPPASLLRPGWLEGVQVYQAPAAPPASAASAPPEAEPPPASSADEAPKPD